MPCCTILHTQNFYDFKKEKKKKKNKCISFGNAWHILKVTTKTLNTASRALQPLAVIIYLIQVIKILILVHSDRRM
jgi:hypothetical protein